VVEYVDFKQESGYKKFYERKMRRRAHRVETSAAKIERKRNLKEMLALDLVKIMSTEKKFSSVDGLLDAVNAKETYPGLTRSDMRAVIMELTTRPDRYYVLRKDIESRIERARDVLNP